MKFSQSALKVYADFISTSILFYWAIEGTSVMLTLMDGAGSFICVRRRLLFGRSEVFLPTRGVHKGRLLSTMLAAIAEFERELIRERSGEGGKRAMAAGVKFGRKRKLSDHQRAEAIKRRAAGETLASIAQSYAVDLSMISRL